ncbi:hypothetical protein PGT21_021244 [Puccinia graminis f. sp. tritici]|uniref:Uncharacterized protein n=1 Tax=Puccinia graminis f. sp. tritici TaxID=56615 RepID=A0A5B0RP96_PUCGR|nr:hypothetical protein PGT21_021244 [Puccinia graminis f. sp. tritici]KAA1126998.1 hypothetical protein PGTUg99_035265 [Puccinia graminis f. sp. tritici]
MSKKIDAWPSFSTPARIDDNSSAIVFHPREPRKKLADQPFWNRPIHLNRASKKARRPFWNRPIRFKRSFGTGRSDLNGASTTITNCFQTKPRAQQHHRTRSTIFKFNGVINNINQF